MLEFFLILGGVGFLAYMLIDRFVPEPGPSSWRSSYVSKEESDRNAQDATIMLLYTAAVVAAC